MQYTLPIRLGHYSIVAFLVFLQILHYYWWYKFWEIAYMLFVTKNPRDVVCDVKVDEKLMKQKAA